MLQALLGEYASDGEAAVVATLEIGVVAAGRHAGQPAVHVNIDGHRVGELTHQMSQRYLPLLHELGQGGHVAACEATVRPGDRAPEVQVHLPATTTP